MTSLTVWTRRRLLQTIGASMTGAFAASPRVGATEGGSRRLEKNEPSRPEYSWLNQEQGLRPDFVWENREDLIYHDLSHSDESTNTAPEFCAFMQKTWVFNRTMQWHDNDLNGCILCYSAAGNLSVHGPIGSARNYSPSLTRALSSNSCNSAAFIWPRVRGRLPRNTPSFIVKSSRTVTALRSLGLARSDIGLVSGTLSTWGSSIEFPS